MKPIEKAMDLVNLFINHAQSRNKIGIYDEGLHEYNCKQCALILVDEIIDSEPQYKWSKEYEPIDFWEEVKKEINKL